MKRLQIGGQAVIEGVMMKSAKNIAIAVRKPDGKITVKKEKLSTLAMRYKIFNLPMIRGVFSLFEMMIIGMRALNYSANESIEEDNEKLSAWEIIVSMILAMGFALLLFKVFPLVLTQFIYSTKVIKGSLLFSAIDGIIKILLFIVYIWAISFMKDVKRLFENHGAEHSVVHCYEAGKKLTPDNAIRYTTLHPRCGTSFLIIVILLSIIIYAAIPNTASFLVKLGLRLLLLPVIAGTSYELLKASAKYEKKPIFRWIIKPGLWVQKLTTSQPDKKQVEVAIKALKAVIEMEGKKA